MGYLSRFAELGKPPGVCAYCGLGDGHSPRCSVTRHSAPPYRMVPPPPDMGPPPDDSPCAECLAPDARCIDGCRRAKLREASPVDLDEMHDAVDLLASPLGEHVEHAVREIREGLRIALGEPEPHSHVRF